MYRQTYDTKKAVDMPRVLPLFPFFFGGGGDPERTWLVKEQDMTKEGWPVAHPRLSSRPSASTMTPCPSGKMKRSTCGLMFWTCAAKRSAHRRQRPDDAPHHALL
jgi:hypothetical protein